MYFFFMMHCVSSPGEGLRLPEDHWFDANAVLEDGHRRNLQRRSSEPAGQRRAVEGKYQRWVRQAGTRDCVGR